MPSKNHKYNVYYYPMASLCHGCDNWRERYNNGNADYEPFKAAGDCFEKKVPYGEGCILSAAREPVGGQAG